MKAAKSTLDQAIDVVQDRAPEFFNSNPIQSIEVLMDNADFTDSLVRFDAFVKKNKVDADLVAGTIAHDIAGLYNNESFFSPRVSSY